MPDSTTPSLKGHLPSDRKSSSPPRKPKSTDNNFDFDEGSRSNRSLHHSDCDPPSDRDKASQDRQTRWVAKAIKKGYHLTPLEIQMVGMRLRDANTEKCHEDTLEKWSCALNSELKTRGEIQRGRTALRSLFDLDGGYTGDPTT